MDLKKVRELISNSKILSLEQKDDLLLAIKHYSQLQLDQLEHTIMFTESAYTSIESDYRKDFAQTQEQFSKLENSFNYHDYPRLIKKEHQKEEQKDKVEPEDILKRI